MITVRTIVVLVLVLICLILGSCSSAKELGKTLGSLAVVRSEIIKKFGEEGVDVKINSGGGLKAIFGSSLPNFRQMVSAARLTVQLGDRKFELTSEQFQSLRKMNQYVKN